MGGDENVRMRARRPAMGVAAWCMALIFSALFVLPIIATDVEPALSGEVTIPASISSSCPLFKSSADAACGQFGELSPPCSLATQLYALSGCSASPNSKALESKTSLGEGMAADAPLAQKEAAAKKQAKKAVQKLRNYQKKAQKLSHNGSTKKAANGRKTHKKAKKGKKKLGKNYDNTDKRTKWKEKRMKRKKPPWNFTGATNSHGFFTPIWGHDGGGFMPPRSKELYVCETKKHVKYRKDKVNTLSPIECAAHCNLFPFFAVEADDDCGCYYKDPCKYRKKMRSAKNPKGRKPGKDRAYKNGRFVGSTYKQLKERVRKAHKKWKEDWARRNKKPARLGAASKKAKKQVKAKKDDGCNGWSPSSGKFAGKGKTCGRWGWSRSWCYVDKGFKGPGHEFIQQSTSYKGKYYMPCKMPKVTSGVLAKPADWENCISEGGGLKCATCKEKTGGSGALPCDSVPPLGNIWNVCKIPKNHGRYSGMAIDCRNKGNGLHLHWKSKRINPI